jgi:thioredoxin 1
MNFSVRFLFPAAAVLGLAGLAGCDNPSALNESTANVKHVAQGDFPSQVTRVSGPEVVEFYTVWSDSCRQLAPVLDRLAGPLTNRVKFFKVNVEESPGLAQNFHIETTPTVLLFREGKLVSRITGPPAEADLKSRLESLAAGQ